MDHVSTFAEGASCAVSAVYRGRLERAGGDVAPEALAGDRRTVDARWAHGGRGRSGRGDMRLPRLKAAPKAGAGWPLTRPFSRSLPPVTLTSRCLSCAMRWRRRKASRPTIPRLPASCRVSASHAKNVAGGHRAPSRQGKARAPGLAGPPSGHSLNALSSLMKPP